MPSLVRNVARLQWPFDIRPTGTQIYRRFKVHDLITCESKVQVVVSVGRHEVLFALGRYENLIMTRDTLSPNQKTYLSWEVYNKILCTFLYRPLQDYNVKWPLSGERERQRLIFLIYIPNVTRRSVFSFEVILTMRNKLKDFRDS